MFSKQQTPRHFSQDRQFKWIVDQFEKSDESTAVPQSLRVRVLGETFVKQTGKYNLTNDTRVCNMLDECT